jgi:hypothetical protein
VSPLAYSALAQRGCKPKTPISILAPREAARAVYYRHAFGKYVSGSKKEMYGSERAIVRLAPAQVLAFGNHLHSPLNMVSPSSARMAFGIELAGDTRIPSSLLPVHRRGPIVYDGREITSIYLHDFDRVFLSQFRSLGLK